MRIIVLVLILALIAIIAAIATGFISISQIRGGRAPAMIEDGNQVTAAGGQAPAFDVETGSVKVGTAPANVPLPTLEITRPGSAPEAASNNAN